MQRQALKGSRLRSAGYDERLQTLELEFADRSVRQYQGVPAEVWRRLLSSPNPGSYFEDRIAEEYPSRPASASVDTGARAQLDALFGNASPSRPHAAGDAAGDEPAAPPRD